MNPKIIGSICGLILTAMLYLLSALFERYTEEIDQGESQKANRNPYLAAELYLNAAGKPADSSENLLKLKDLSETGTLFISHASTLISENNAKKLIEWMEQGGNLIVAAHHFDDETSRNFLLERFEVSTYLVECDDCNPLSNEFIQQRFEDGDKFSDIVKDQFDLLANPQDDVILESEITTLNFESYDKALKIHFSPVVGIYHDSLYSNEDEKENDTQGYELTYSAGTENADHFLQFKVGSGILSVISDELIWTSDNIASLDHAYLLWILTDENRETTLLYGAIMPSIHLLIWRSAPELIISLIALLCLWVVYASRRFGPIIDIDTSTRRSIEEHIYASADFLWRHKQSKQLIEPLREEIQHKIRIHYPLLNHMGEQEIYRLIGERSHLPVESIHWALHEPSPFDDDLFLNMISILKHIREIL